MIKQLVINFILGGIIFASIYISANVYDNPDISALISLFPISILCGFIIKKETTLINHYYHLIPVGTISILCVILLIIMLKNNISNKLAIFISLILWTGLQLLKIKFW